MDLLSQNDSGHWTVISSQHELHSGDPVRVLLDNQWAPARIQLDSTSNRYVVIIDGGERVIPIVPDMDIRPVADEIL